MGRNCPSLQLLQSTEIPAKNSVCLSRSQRPSMLKLPTMSHAVVTSQIYLSSNIEDVFLSNVATNNKHNTTYLHTIFLMALVTKSTSASTFVMRSPFSADCHAISNGYHTNAYTLVLQYTCIEISNADSLGIIYLWVSNFSMPENIIEHN